MTDLPDPALLLQQLSADAMRLEQHDPAAAIQRWRQMLTLLPPNSPAHAAVTSRIAGLSGERSPSVVPVGEDQMMPEGSPGARAQHHESPPLDPMPVAVAKTLGSMAVSIAVYYYFSKDLGFSIGFVVLMLVHEMGHVFATWHYKLSASPPIFIPFMGALINLRESPQNALVESVIGIAGPVLGTVGALVCLAAALATHDPHWHHLLLYVAEWGFFLNLINLLPVPPLDGGRVTAAVSPWIWMLGIVALGGGIVYIWRVLGQLPIIMILIFLYALPRLKETFLRRGRDLPYYHIPRSASWIMGTLYVVLGILLIALWVYGDRHLGPGSQVSF
jgi:Zn-dependent protease